MGLEKEPLRELIIAKLADGSLPQNSIPRVWGGAGRGEICDACSLVVNSNEIVMEGVSTDAATKQGIQFHVKCFYLWDSLRDAPGRRTTRS